MVVRQEAGRARHIGDGPSSYTEEASVGYTWLGHTQHYSPPLRSPGPLGREVQKLCCVGLLEKKECEGKKIIYITTLLKQNEQLNFYVHCTLNMHASHCDGFESTVDDVCIPPV